mmetsp:Transcript_12664/g.22975  ORF Transcript_12664/g.22975 Transcript_12664/m.22975 type:complete len:229 (+) Transcript_12664:418-1104(+)
MLRNNINSKVLLSSLIKSTLLHCQTSQDRARRKHITHRIIIQTKNRKLQEQEARAYRCRQDNRNKKQQHKQQYDEQQHKQNQKKDDQQVSPPALSIRFTPSAERTQRKPSRLKPASNQVGRSRFRLRAVRNHRQRSGHSVRSLRSLSRTQLRLLLMMIRMVLPSCKQRRGLRGMFEATKIKEATKKRPKNRPKNLPKNLPILWRRTKITNTRIIPRRRGMLTPLFGSS